MITVNCGSTILKDVETFGGCSSVVERHVANVNVVSSSLITRFWMFIDYSIGEIPSRPIRRGRALVADAFNVPVREMWRGGVKILPRRNSRTGNEWKIWLRELKCP